MNTFVQKYQQAAADKIVINITTSARRNPRDGMSSHGSTKAALVMTTRVAPQEAEVRKIGD